MEHREGRFRGLEDVELYYQSWLPDGDPRAILLVVVGFAEHGGRYGNVVEHFVPKGYAVCAVDHRGHGKSEGLRGYVERFSYYTADLKTYFDIVRAEHGDKKIFLLGHSMGAMIAVSYAVRYQHELAGLMVSGMGLKPGSSLSPVMIVMARLLSLLVPKVGVTVLDASTICQDKAVVDAYENDPLVYRGKVRARLGAEMLRAIRELPQQARGISLPVLIMHGTADRLCDHEGSRMLYEAVGSEDKTLKLYDGFYHEILNEPGRGQVLADMEAWLGAHL
jgi:alpha-beta hydrolase superfamily lysophospholipase